MNDVELGWVAGLLEGEGYFCFDPGYRITCEMTDEDVIQKLNALVPGSIEHYESRKAEWKESYRWVIRSSDAIALAEKIKPLLGERRLAKVEEMITRWYARKALVDEREVNMARAVADFKESGLSIRQVAARHNVNRTRLGKLVK